MKTQIQVNVYKSVEDEGEIDLKILIGLQDLLNRLVKEVQ